ncbi:MAG: ABC transporter permease [Candidatus Saccharibacteria bacterium]|nr:ABC transporter permease [Candidatus Saccharibacteria bacterium]
MRSKTFEVIRFETMRQLKKPAFWAATLLIPLLIGGIYLISFLSAKSVEKDPVLKEDTKIAITDEAGIFNKETPFLVDVDKDAGREMVKTGKVDLYFYIPKDFAETKKADFYHISEGLDIFNNDANILKTLLSNEAASKVGELDTLALTGKYEVTDHKLNHDGEDSNALGKAIVPFAIGIVFFMFVALCGNRFLLNVVEEKENRISEMILTSISAHHLIVGKIIALLILSAIQILVLVIPIAILIFVNRDSQMISGILNMIEVEPITVILSALLFIASVMFYAGTCTFVGALTSTAKDASSFIGPAIILIVFPLYFMQMFMATDPNAIVQFMTYFPFTAPIALMLRSGFGTISTLEFCIGLAVVAVSAVIMTRLAIVTFQKNAINFGSPRLRSRRKR